MASRPQILRAPRFSESPLLPAVLLCLGVAALAAQIGLAAIIGAFLAGLMVAETKEQHPIEDEVAPLYAFFPPFFFAFIGIKLELGELVDGGTLALLVAVTALATVTKLLGAWLERAASMAGMHGSSLSGWSPGARWASSSPASALRSARSTRSSSR